MNPGIIICICSIFGVFSIAVDLLFEGKISKKIPVRFYIWIIINMIGIAIGLIMNAILLINEIPCK